MKRLVLVRHAPTASTRAAAFPRDDEGLDADGRAAAAALVCRAGTRSAARPGGAWRRPRPRAWSRRSSPRWPSATSGRGRGGRWPTWSRAEARAWMTDPDAAPHGGESLRTFAARVAAWLDGQAAADGRAVAITHGGVVKAAIVAALGAPLEAFWRVDVAPLALAELHAHDGRWTVTRVNAPAPPVAAWRERPRPPLRLGGRPGPRRPAPLAPGRGLRPARAGARARALRAQPRPRRALRRRPGGAGGARRRGGRARAPPPPRPGRVHVGRPGRPLAGPRGRRRGRRRAQRRPRRRAPALPALVGRDPDALDATGICRATVESVAENTADAVVGVLLWGAVAGPAGVAAYRAANTLDAMVGHRSERYADFGWAAARLDDVLTWPVARSGRGARGRLRAGRRRLGRRGSARRPARRRRAPEPERRSDGGRLRRRARRASRRPAGLRGPGRGAPAAR